MKTSPNSGPFSGLFTDKIIKYFKFICSLSLTSDGLPVAYTREELYDRVSELKIQIKRDKSNLTELHTLFSYVRKMMDSVAETSFLGG